MRIDKLVSILFLDVDGTMTDGKIYIGDNGEMFKAFSVKDGYAIGVELPAAGITPIIITARSSKILEFRCREIGVKYLYQGIKDKISKMEEIINNLNDDQTESFNSLNVAYIGDDLPDFGCMRLVKESGGLTGCPADAVDEIKEIADYICKFKGGEGAVREFIEWIINKKNKRDDI